MLESLSYKVAGLKAGFIKKRLLHKCFPVTIAKVLRTAFLYRTPPLTVFFRLSVFVFVWRGKYSVLGICWHSLLNQKHNLGWLLLIRVVDLVDLSMFFTYISISHSNTFLLMNFQKTKTCPKENIAVKAICSDTRFLQFRQVFIHCLMSILILCK